MGKCKGSKCKSSTNCDDCVTKHLTREFKEKRARAILKAKVGASSYNQVKRETYDPFYWARGLPAQQIFKQPKRQDLAFTLQDVENQIEKAFAKRDKQQPNGQIFRIIHENIMPLAPKHEKTFHSSIDTSTDDLPSFTKILTNTQGTQFDVPQSDQETQHDAQYADNETQHEAQYADNETQHDAQYADQGTQYEPDEEVVIGTSPYEEEVVNEDETPLQPSPEVGSLSLASAHETSQQITPSFSQSINDAINSDDVGAETMRMLLYSDAKEPPNQSYPPSEGEEDPQEPLFEFEGLDTPRPSETDRLESSYEPNKSQKKAGYYAPFGQGLQPDFGSSPISPVVLPKLKLPNVVETPRRDEVDEVRGALEKQRNKTTPETPLSPILGADTTFPITPFSPHLSSESEPKNTFQLSSRGDKKGGKKERVRRTDAQIAADKLKMFQGQPTITMQFPTDKNSQLAAVDKDDLEAQKAPIATSRPVFNFIGEL